MKLERKDFVQLRAPLGWALAMLVLAAGIGLYTHHELRQATQARQTAEQARQQIEQRLRQVRTEEEDIKSRTQAFLTLQQAGITGEERRLEWTEQLRALQQELRIPGMSYEFGAQSALDKTEGAPFAWFASPMQLKLRLLHEEDLLRFLGRLQREARAMIVIRACRVAPVVGNSLPGEAVALLTAECDLQWITLRQAKGKGS